MIKTKKNLIPEISECLSDSYYITGQLSDVKNIFKLKSRDDPELDMVLKVVPFKINPTIQSKNFIKEVLIMKDMSNYNISPIYYGHSDCIINN